MVSLYLGPELTAPAASAASRLPCPASGGCLAVSRSPSRVLPLPASFKTWLIISSLMKKVGQQLSPRSNSPSQQYFSNRLGNRISPKNSRLADTAVTVASSSTARQLLNAPIATSRTNRSKSIREALDSIKQRSISKNKPVVRRLLPSVKSTDKISDHVELHKEKSPSMRPLANITGSFLNKTINGFSKIKPARDAHLKDNSKIESMESSTHDLLKNSILQAPSQTQNTVQVKPEKKLVCK